MTSVVPMAAVDKGHFQRSPETQAMIDRFDAKHGAGSYDSRRREAIRIKSTEKPTITTTPARDFIDSITQGDVYKMKPSDPKFYHRRADVLKKYEKAYNSTFGGYDKDQRRKAQQELSQARDYILKHSRLGHVEHDQVGSLLREQVKR